MAENQSAVVGGWLVALGALGVAAITAIYASAPTAASAPLPAGTPIAEALAATVGARSQLWMAGTIGMVADVILIAGCLVLALRSGEPVTKRLFWIWLMLSTAIFFVVDGLAGAVLPELAAETGADQTAYLFARRAYDAAFALGVGTFGVGFVAAGLGSTGTWRWVTLTLGVASMGAFGLHLFGVTVPLLLGICVGIAGVLGAFSGYREARTI